MATRIQKVKECDRAMCRRRKGVYNYKMILKERIYEPDTEDVTERVDQIEGELCPAHAAMARKFMSELFKNKKEYDDGTDQATDCNHTNRSPAEGRGV